LKVGLITECLDQQNKKRQTELLSYLKRIVSEEPAQKEGAKLVLTPSQRVGLDPKPRAPRPLVLSHSLEAKVTQLEEIIARSDYEWEPDGDDDSDHAGSFTATLDWERVADAARDELDKTVLQVIDEPVARTDVEHLNDEEMDALREIVAKIVREELKGHLCDQITAKIRQMVQREIKA
jgi:hypothetical protein